MLNLSAFYERWGSVSNWISSIFQVSTVMLRIHVFDNLGYSSNAAILPQIVIAMIYVSDDKDGVPVHDLMTSNGELFITLLYLRFTVWQLQQQIK